MDPFVGEAFVITYAMVFAILCDGRRDAACHIFDSATGCPGCANPGQRSFYLRVDWVLRKLRRYADRVLDGIGVRRSVGDEANSFYAQQGCSTIFSMVETFLEISKRAAREQSANLARNGSLQRFLQSRPKSSAQRFPRIRRRQSHQLCRYTGRGLPRCPQN